MDDDPGSELRAALEHAKQALYHARVMLLGWTVKWLQKIARGCERLATWIATP